MVPPEITSEALNSLPPYGPHTLTAHITTWAAVKKFCEGDLTLFMSLKSLYPRIFPFGLTAQLAAAVGQKLALSEEYALAAFLEPGIWAENKTHATSHWRKEQAMKGDEFKYYVVDVAGIRLYVLAYPKAATMAAIFMWQHAGKIISSRFSESVLPDIENNIQVIGEYPHGLDTPPPTFFPETESHGLLRKRISDLLMRAPIQEPKGPVRPDDVYLYQTGMAAIYGFHEVVASFSKDIAVVFGAVYHSTVELLKESVNGLKQYGIGSDADVDEFEKYLEEGGKCSYVLTEVPSNPVMACVDLARLRRLADKYGFFLAVDDTLGSFSNIDMLPVADVIITSLTKSFSGYADVMAGSVALNPGIRSYQKLKPLFTQFFHNELFSGDATHLFKNSEDYLARSIVLNRNATTLATYFHTLVEDPSVPITRIFYPPYSEGSNYVQQFLRKPTPEFPSPAYGCVFSVEFQSIEDTIAFYDSIRVHCSPHLGAHLTMCLPYNMVGNMNKEEFRIHHNSIGLVENQLRFSMGLEDDEHLLEVCKHAVEKMLEAVNGRELTNTNVSEA